METKTKIIFAGGIVILLGFLFVIGLGERGAVDLYQTKLKRDRMIKSNVRLRAKNKELYKTIKRLNEDADFVENIARTEFGMTGGNEIIILKKRGKNKKTSLRQWADDN